MNLTIRREWLQPGHEPGTLVEAPFEEMRAGPVFGDPGILCFEPWRGTLESFAERLLEVLKQFVRMSRPPVHLALSGGYDSRILAVLLERVGAEPVYVTDGMEPTQEVVLDFLEVPASRRYVHDMDRPDPYGIVDAEPFGFAPLYSCMRFFPAATNATLITGLGGGEWFSYPAANWHDGKRKRREHDTLLDMWLDSFPQYWPLPRRWGAVYRKALHPYTSYEYALVAGRCRREWLRLVNPTTGLDLVREAMLNELDGRLVGLGWSPHVYDWRLTAEQKEEIDTRYADSWLTGRFEECRRGQPSLMDGDIDACTLAGFARWCDQLMADGATISG